MRAITYYRYGAPDVIQLEQIARPEANDGEVLIRVRAASVNPLEWHYMRGEPVFMRLSEGLTKPKNPRLGVDFAGVVEAVGAGVTEFKPGDRVYGGRTGAYADYITKVEKNLAPIPANVSFEQAAALPVAGLTALQGLRDHGQLQAGQSVLINGAAGGIGTYAVQIAKALGAHVTGVCSTRNVDMVKRIGADVVIDYTQQDFTRLGQRYDVLLDNIGNHSVPALRRVVTPTGRLVIAGGPPGRWIGPVKGTLQAMMIKPFSREPHIATFMASIIKADLLYMNTLMAAGKVTSVIDRCYPLEEVAEAIRYVEQGHARGKVVIRVSGDTPA